VKVKSLETFACFTQTYFFPTDANNKVPSDQLPVRRSPSIGDSNDQKTPNQFQTERTRIPSTWITSSTTTTPAPPTTTRAPLRTTPQSMRPPATVRAPPATMRPVSQVSIVAEISIDFTHSFALICLSLLLHRFNRLFSTTSFYRGPTVPYHSPSTDSLVRPKKSLSTSVSYSARHSRSSPGPANASNKNTFSPASFGLVSRSINHSHLELKFLHNWLAISTTSTLEIQ
jgi:hypothetical protein